MFGANPFGVAYWGQGYAQNVVQVPVFFQISTAGPSWEIAELSRVSPQVPPIYGSGMIGQSVSSLQNIRYAVRATVNGIAYNPTGDAVQFGFLPSATNLANVVPSSWVSGDWETDTITGQTAYVATCLVGPGGDFAPAASTVYWVWVKITDNPEIPVLLAGQLQVT